MPSPATPCQAVKARLAKAAHALGNTKFAGLQFHVAVRPDALSFMAALLVHLVALKDAEQLQNVSKDQAAVLGVKQEVRARKAVVGVRTKVSAKEEDCPKVKRGRPLSAAAAAAAAVVATESADAVTSRATRKKPAAAAAAGSESAIANSRAAKKKPAAAVFAAPAAPGTERSATADAAAAKKPAEKPTKTKPNAATRQVVNVSRVPSLRGEEAAEPIKARRGRPPKPKTKT